MNIKKVQERIRNGQGYGLPDLASIEFVCFVPEFEWTSTYSDDTEFDDEYAWAIYISHDPCHDSETHKEDRNTVIALHRNRGDWKIIGRELNRDYALKLASGKV